MREELPTQKNLEDAYAVNSRIDAIRDLNINFRSRTKHELSASLPENKSINIADYKKVLHEYQVGTDDLWTYEQAHSEKKRDFRNNPNIGWKFHLNVPPSAIKEVSKYLKERGYMHKYLSGGQPSKGKVFTVYIGSYQLVTKLAEKVSEELRKYLCRPLNGDEIELASGVVGRFVGEPGKYDHYGSSGMPWLLKDVEESGIDPKGNKLPKDTRGQILVEDIEERVFQALQKQYGPYFFDAGK